VKKICFLFVLGFLQSCLSGGSDYYRDRVEPFLRELKPNYKPQIVDGVMEPAVFPDLEEDQETLVGIDSNKDGVRDDMEIFINRNFKYDYEREALKGDYKRAPYYFKNYKKLTADEKVVFESNYNEEQKCLTYAYEYLKLPISPEIRKYMGTASLYNTDKRKDAFNYEYQSMSGKIYGEGYGDPKVYSSCKKRIDDKYNLKSK
jgi:hypothetical protein